MDSLDEGPPLPPDTPPDTPEDVLLQPPSVSSSSSYTLPPNSGYATSTGFVSPAPSGYDQGFMSDGFGGGGRRGGLMRTPSMESLGSPGRHPHTPRFFFVLFFVCFVSLVFFFCSEGLTKKKQFIGFII